MLFHRPHHQETRNFMMLIVVVQLRRPNRKAAQNNLGGIKLLNHFIIH